MATNAVGKKRLVKKVDPNGNIYYDESVSSVVYDPERGVSVKQDIDELRARTQTAMEFIAANPKGLDGKSAYELAVDSGFEGTLDEWLTSIHGEPGEDGLSAYELAVLHEGFVGTVNEWLDSLKGDPGEKGDSEYDLAVQNGYEGTVEEWLDERKGVRITEEQIQEIYDRYATAIESGDIESDVLSTITEISNKVNTLQVTIQDMIVDLSMDNETGKLTATKYSGDTIVNQIIIDIDDDDINNAIAGFILEGTDAELVQSESDTTNEVYLDTQSSFLKDEEGGEN